MPERTATVASRVGLHARPAAIFAEAAGEFDLDITIAKDKKAGLFDELSSDWEEWTLQLCIATRRALLAHPNAAPLILQFFPRHLLLDAYEHSVKRYPRTRSKHMAILEGIEKLTFGSALFAAAARAKGIPGMPDVDPARHPHLAQSVAASGYDDEGTFVEALRMLLAGIRLRTQDEA